MRQMVREVVDEAYVASSLGVAGEHSPAYDHRANRLVERAVREVKDQVRVMRVALVAKVGAIPLSCAVIDWLVEWAAEALGGAQVGDDGMTAHRRLRGREWEPRVAGFGEKVLARRPPRPSTRQPQNLDGTCVCTWGRDGGRQSTSSQEITGECAECARFGVWEKIGGGTRPPLEACRVCLRSWAARAALSWRCLRPR